MNNIKFIFTLIKFNIPLLEISENSEGVIVLISMKLKNTKRRKIPCVFWYFIILSLYNTKHLLCLQSELR